jgi:hypothetical protein
MSTFGTNLYGQNNYGGPAVISESVSDNMTIADAPSAAAAFRPSVAEAGSAADAPSVEAIFRPLVVEAGSLSDAADITHYTQAPLPVSPMRNRTYRRR